MINDLAPRPVSRLEIFRAVPSGSRRARNQGQALHALALDAELSAMRRHRQRNVRAVWRVLVRRADWRNMTSRPVVLCGPCRAGGDCRELGRQACLCRAADVSVSTWKAARRLLESSGYLATVRPGRAPWLRPGVLTDPDTPNEAAVYVLCIPRSKTAPGPPAASPQPETRPLSRSARSVVSVPAHAESQDQETDSARAETHFLDAVARVARISAGQGITDGWVSYLVRPYLAAGWAWRDLSHALAHDPGGSTHRTSLKHVKAPRAWLAWRLAQWIGPDGSPLPSHSAELAERAEQSRAQRRAAAAAAAELDARPRPDPAPYTAALRDWLRARRGTTRDERIMRWIQYPDTGDRAARRNGRRRQGEALPLPSPLPGYVWAKPDDDEQPVLVRPYPEAPERNYALDVEQVGGRR